MRSWIVFPLCFTVALVATNKRLMADVGDAWVVHGRVVDADGRAAQDIDVAWYWSANGTPHDADGRPWPKPQDNDVFRQKVAGDGWKAMWRDVGTMTPKWYHESTLTQPDGGFTLRVGRKEWAIIAMDRARRRGAMAFVDRDNGDIDEPLVLRDLVEVKGRFAHTQLVHKPKWTNLAVELEPDL
jgi:hypothetical protein